MENDKDSEAIFVKEGLIHKVGAYEEMIKYKSDETIEIDLAGKTLMPAFIDAHSHLIAFATTLDLVSLSDATTFDDILQKLIKFKENKKPSSGDWIIGFGYDHNDLIEKKHPTKSVLDRVTMEHPILISHASGHMGVANSRALQELQINSDTKDPEGGHIARCEGGTEPNGYLEETAFTNNASKIEQPSLEETCTNIEEAQRIYLSYGITTAQEGLVNSNEFHLLKKMSDENRLVIDVIGYVDLKNSPSICDNFSEYTQKFINQLKIGGFKIFLDGSPQGKTAWLTKPYENSNENYCGYPIYKDKEVEHFVNTAIDKGMQLLTHCNGDAAADQLIFCFKKVLSERKLRYEMRPVMIHAQTVRCDQLEIMKDIGMIPSYFVEHTYYWGDVHIKNLGRDRAFRISPVQTTIQKELPFTLHQDTPVVLPDMLHTVWCAVNRVTKSGTVIGEAEKVSPLEALKGVTIYGAYSYFEEDIKGSIKEGKQANLIILDENPLEVDPMTIKDIKVLETIKQGKTVFKRKYS